VRSAEQRSASARHGVRAFQGRPDAERERGDPKRLSATESSKRPRQLTLIRIKPSALHAERPGLGALLSGLQQILSACFCGASAMTELEQLRAAHVARKSLDCESSGSFCHALLLKKFSVATLFALPASRGTGASDSNHGFY
jgi:hypothetical protein